MKSLFIRCLANAVVLLCLGLMPLGCTKEPPATGEDGASTEVYTDEDFGFSLEYPSNWHVVPAEETADLIATGRRELEERQGISHSAKYRQLVLISKYPFPSSEPTPGMATLLMGAEELPVPPTTITDGFAYLTSARKLYDRTDLQVEFAGEPYRYPVNGAEFYRLDHRCTEQGMTFRQSSLATVVREHALVIILVGLSEDEMSELETIVSTLRFQQLSSEGPPTSETR